jgi:hypothetical protein
MKMLRTLTRRPAGCALGRLTSGRLGGRLAVVVVTIVCAPATAQTLLPRTPGLWQVDATTVIAALGIRQSASEKLCITPEVARRDIAPPSALQEDGWTCRSQLSAGSAQKASYRLSCRKGAATATGSGEVVMNGANAFRGGTLVQAKEEGMAFEVRSSYEARFLSAACGSAPLLKWEGVSETPRK